MGEQAEIQFAVRGRLGRITLNRPQALNALSHQMCLRHAAKLKEWARDKRVRAVLIRGSGRAFCAGGDVVALYEARERLEAYAYPFYRDQYRGNARLFRFSKPYIALIDGIVMGGGVGVSLHGSHRVVTERALFAMPETGIGLFPDVGASHFLPRCPGRIGSYLGLTGARLRAADMLYAGIADHYLPSQRLGALEAALAGAELSGQAHAAVTELIEGFAEHSGAAPLEEHRDRIDRCFAPDSVERIIAALDAEGGAWARETAAVLARKSPTSLKLADRLLRAGAELEFDDCMRLEYRLVRRCLARHDLYEGIRAQVIGKDRAPRWRPERLDEVTEALIQAHFEPLGADELRFDWEQETCKK